MDQHVNTNNHLSQAAQTTPKNLTVMKTKLEKFHVPGTPLDPAVGAGKMIAVGAIGIAVVSIGGLIAIGFGARALYHRHRKNKWLGK